MAVRAPAPGLLRPRPGGAAGEGEEGEGGEVLRLGRGGGGAEVQEVVRAQAEVPLLPPGAQTLQVPLQGDLL